MTAAKSQEQDPRPDASESSGGDLDNLTGALWLPQILVALATLLAVVSVFSTWVRVQALDTDTWVSLADEVVQDPAVQEALSTYIVDELYRELDVTAELEGRLPEDYRGIAGPLSAALRGPTTNGVGRLISSDEFAQAWLLANRAAHRSLVAILRDETPTGVSTSDGTVTLELGELVRVVGADLGLSESLLERLPEDAGRVVLFESGELDAAQTGVQILDFLSWFLFLFVVALYAVAVYLARDRRLAMLRNVGLSLIGAGVFVIIVRAIGVRVAVDAVVERPRNEAVATVIASFVTRLIRQIAWTGVIYGVVVAGFASLLGERPRARATRRFLAPAFNGSPVSVAGTTFVLFILLIWWSPGRSFESWVSALTLVALLIAAVVALRRSITQEFPTVTFADLTESVRAMSLPTAARAGRSDDQPSMISQLKDLDDLRTRGALDDGEYALAKQRVLGGAQVEVVD